MLIDVRILDRNEQLDLNSLVSTMLRLDERCGAITLFIGLVKGLVEENKRVHELEYTVVKEAALEIMGKIAREEAEKYKLSHVVIWHRVGSLKPGEVTIIIAVLAENRKNSFAAAEEILERVKKEVPIFKLEKRSNGEYWVIGSELRVKREK